MRKQRRAISDDKPAEGKPLPGISRPALPVMNEVLTNLVEVVKLSEVVVRIASNERISTSTEASVVPLTDPKHGTYLEVVDTVTSHLETLVGIDERFAVHLAAVASQLNGLRHDMAELFGELKTGNIANAMANTIAVATAITAATAAVAQSVLVKQAQEHVQTRLDHLEREKG